MINPLKYANILGMLFCVFFLGACSVSDGFDNAGIEGTGDKDGDLLAARGSVTKFGSIYVNGIHFNTDDAQFFIGETEANEDEIKQGMVVYVEGVPGANTQEAKANIVKFDYIVQGQIESIENISSNKRIITLLGYSISLTEDAMIDKSAFDQLEPGNFIAVSGLFETDNAITATRVDLPSDGTLVTITGHITSHNGASLTFAINNQSIDYSASSFSGLDSSQLSIGSTVRVVGTLNPETNVIAATRIQYTSKDKHLKYISSEEGVINNFISMTDFHINSIKVNAASAQITGDLKQIIGNGTRITISGSTNEANVFIADSVYVHYRSSSRVSGPVTNIDREAGTIFVSGIEFHVGSFTNFEDLGPRNNRYFNLDDLALGDQIDMFSQADNDDYVAITLRRKQAENGKVQIKGKISAFSTSAQFYMIGILIDAREIDQEVLSQLNLDDSVFVIGEYTDNAVFQASEIYTLKNKCTSHREIDCNKQTPSFWDDNFEKDRTETNDKEPRDMDGFDIDPFDIDSINGGGPAKQK